MLIIVGPSASGKSAIVNEIQKMSNLKKVITYTTREKRWNEVDGVDYHFLTLTEFTKLNAEDFFFETVKYNDNYYGTAKKDIVKENVVILEPSGLKAYLEKVPNEIKIAYIDSSSAIRLARMQERKDADAVIEKRLKNDEAYFEEVKKYADIVIVNENKSLTKVAQEVIDFYLQYE